MGSELLWSNARPRGGLCSAGAVSASDTTSAVAVTHLGASRVARPTCQAGARPPKNSLNAVVAEETTPRNIGTVESGRRRSRAPAGPVVKTGAPSGGVRSATARSQPSPEQMSLVDDWNHVLRGGRVARAQTATLPNPVHRSLKPLRRLQ